MSPELRSEDKEKAVVWVFHDEKFDPVGRKYNLPKANALNGKKFTIPLDPAITYKATAYNTWSGDVAAACTPDVKTENGKITVTVKDLATTERAAWDGADILYVLEKKPPQ